MKKIFKHILLAVLVISFYGCRDFEELSKNPNGPADVPPSLILRGVMADIYERPWSLEHRQNQFWCCNYNYYGSNEYWTNAPFNYTTLKNVLKMEEAAKASGDLNPYSAMAKYFKAYFFVKMTLKVGDLPMDDALLGLENTEPAYNTQKEVYQQALVWLDEANSDLKTLIANGNTTMQGDIYYANDLNKWRKVVNTFKLRVLISLSKKENDADLQVKSRFAEVMNNPSEFPVMESNTDNMNYIYNGGVQLYPTNPGERGKDKGRYNMAQTYVKGLTDLNDPRVYVTCNPAKAKITGAGALEADDFKAFVGAPSGESLDDMTTKAGSGLYSYSNQIRYYGSYIGPEPGVQMAYWELCFNIAEAINRGWITGNANTYYQNGIKASMSFYGITDGALINITESDNDVVLKTVTASVTDYLAQTAVTYAGNNATGLNQILTQKYLAFFQNSGQEAYFNSRRTGVPVFDIGVGTGNSGVIPNRWLYPTDEGFYNTTNYKSALMSQFNSEVDDVDYDLWINVN
ncbi:MAG: SusD/RagB family nutrient-binding outer membrane lipoprotein [Chryseolinea sp.]